MAEHPWLHARLRFDPGDVSHCFARDVGWERHDSFYQCWMATVTEHLPPPLIEQARSLVSEALGVPLIEHARVSAQRMDPGDQATIHTDEPALGFETHRLVVHLHTCRGGELLLQDASGTEHMRIAPERGGAFAFELTSGAWHTVLPCLTQRDALVFHFWHPGNAPAIATSLRDLFAHPRFGELPAAAQPLLDACDAELSEEESLLAGLAAWAAHKSGEDPVRCLQGDPSPEFVAARWAASLWREGFDRSRWEAAQVGRGSTLGRLLFP